MPHGYFEYGFRKEYVNNMASTFQIEMLFKSGKMQDCALKTLEDINRFYISSGKHRKK